MYLVFFHSFVLMDMLRPKGVVLAKNHTHAQQQNCHQHKPYCHQYLHILFLFCTRVTYMYAQNMVQRYYKFCTYANIRVFFFKK